MNRIVYRLGWEQQANKPTLGVVGIDPYHHKGLTQRSHKSDNTSHENLSEEWYSEKIRKKNLFLSENVILWIDTYPRHGSKENLQVTLKRPWVLPQIIVF